MKTVRILLFFILERKLIFMPMTWRQTIDCIRRDYPQYRSHADYKPTGLVTRLHVVDVRNLGCYEASLRYLDNNIDQICSLIMAGNTALLQQIFENRIDRAQKFTFINSTFGENAIRFALDSTSHACYAIAYALEQKNDNEYSPLVKFYECLGGLFKKF